MKKKIQQKVGIVIAQSLYMSAKSGTTLRYQEDRVIMELRAAGLKDGQLVGQEVDPKNKDVFYYFMKEVEVEDFETPDPNRYETYLTWFINEIVIKLSVFDYDPIEEFKFSAQAIKATSGSAASMEQDFLNWIKSHKGIYGY